MADVKPDSLDPSQQRQMALSRWDNEGGAGPAARKGPKFPGRCNPKFLS